MCIQLHIKNLNVQISHISSTCRRSGYPSKTKPEVVHDYNKHMLGVDKLDQLASYYSFLHKSVKWWRKVFFWAMEVAVVNSYIIYKEHMSSHSQRPMQHSQYRRKLVEELADPLRSTAIPSGPSHSRGSSSLERLQRIPHFLEKGKKRRDCCVCSDREESRHLTMFYCKTCTDSPALCPAPCMEIYHTKRKYQGQHL